MHVSIHHMAMASESTNNLRVVLVVLAVVLLVEVLGLLLGLVLGLLSVEEVKALGLEELVNLSTGNASKSLLGKGVLDGLACDVLVL